MRRIIRVLAVAVLVAMILVTSISPALARRAAGGQQLSTRVPCDRTTENAQNDHHGADLRNVEDEDEDPETGRAEGCWALLPYAEDR
jgi:hypothetical protein